MYQVSLLKQVLNRMPNQPHAPVPLHHQPVPHTQCLSCKLSMCNNSKCAILVHKRSILFLWIPNNIGITSRTLELHQRNNLFTRVLFACMSGGYHQAPTVKAYRSMLQHLLLSPVGGGFEACCSTLKIALGLFYLKNIVPKYQSHPPRAVICQRRIAVLICECDDSMRTGRGGGYFSPPCWGRVNTTR